MPKSVIFEEVVWDGEDGSPVYVFVAGSWVFVETNPEEGSAMMSVATAKKVIKALQRAVKTAEEKKR